MTSPHNFKKNITLALGALFLSAAILLPSFASREAYHAYLTSKQAQDKGIRNFSEGRSVRLKERLRQKKVQASLNRTAYRGRNLRYSQENTRDTYRSKDAKKGLTLRTSTDAVRGWSSPLHRKAIIAQNIKKQDVIVRTYENDAFSVQVPKGWNNSADEAHTFSNIANDLVINIKKVPSSTCERLEGFDTCAIAISRNENRKAISGSGELLSSSRVVRQSQKSDTFLNRPDLRTNTFTESFSAYVPGSGEQLINRYFVADQDNGVYLLEITSSVQNAKSNVKISKTIFDSFRIYPQE